MDHNLHNSKTNANKMVVNPIFGSKTDETLIFVNIRHKNICCWAKLAMLSQFTRHRQPPPPTASANHQPPPQTASAADKLFSYL